MAISLPDAARELGVDPSGLRRWVKRAHIELLTDPADQRRRMLRDEDFERLRGERASLSRAGASSATQELRHLLDELRAEIETLRDTFARQNSAINQQLAALLFQVTNLSERVTRLEDARRAAR